MAKITCDQCNMAMIKTGGMKHALACHETGCPNSKKTWDVEREQWIQYVDCFECGCPVEVGERCDCQDSMEEN